MKAKGSQFAMQPDGPVYHGSGHGFAPGDTVDPTPDTIHMKGESAAFGGTSTSTAGYFGLKGAAEPREGQGRLFSSVYEVGPKSEYEVHPSLHIDIEKSKKYAKGGDPRVYMPESNTLPIDREGFEVNRHVAFSMPDQSTEALRGGYVMHDIQPTPITSGQQFKGKGDSEVVTPARSTPALTAKAFGGEQLALDV